MMHPAIYGPVQYTQHTNLHTHYLLPPVNTALKSHCNPTNSKYVLPFN